MGLQSWTNVVAIGLNCTAPDLVPALLTSVADMATKPLVAYPNSGEVWDSREGHRHWHNHNDMMKVLDGADAVQMYRYGARAIGGCCNVRHGQIAQFRASLDNMQLQQDWNMPARTPATLTSTPVVAARSRL